VRDGIGEALRGDGQLRFQLRRGRDHLELCLAACDDHGAVIKKRRSIEGFLLLEFCRC